MPSPFQIIFPQLDGVKINSNGTLPIAVIQGIRKAYEYINALQGMVGEEEQAAGLGPYVRTLDLSDLTPGTAIAPLVPIWEAGPGIRAIGVLRKPITSDLVIAIRRNAEVTPLFTFTLPASTAVGVDVTLDISDITFLDLDVLIPDITASDGSSDPNGVATLTIEWGAAGVGATGGGGGGGGGGGFTAGGDLSGTSTVQRVIGLQGVALDNTTVGAPADGQVITYDAATGKYEAETLPSVTYVPILVNGGVIVYAIGTAPGAGAAAPVWSMIGWGVGL